MVKTVCFQCNGSIPCWGTKIPHAIWHGKKKKNYPNFKHSVKILEAIEKLIIQEMKDL